MFMTTFGRFPSRLGLGLFVSLLATAPLAAAPGDAAAGQDDYKAIRDGAQYLQQARTNLTSFTGKFGGHRVKAIGSVHDALDELDMAVAAAKGK